MELNRAFEDILMDFFYKHDKKYRRKVKNIVKQFDGREKEVIINLCSKYKVSPASIDGIVLSEEEKEKYAQFEIAQDDKGVIEDKYKNVASDTSINDEESSDQDKHSKSDMSYDTDTEELNNGGKKKKLILIAVIAILLIGGIGTGAYFYMGSDNTNTETDVVETGEVIENDQPATTLDSTQAVDSTQGVDSLSSDSSAVDSSQTVEENATDSSNSNKDQEAEE